MTALSNLRKPLFTGTIANGATKYVGVPIKNGALGCQIAWKDATSAADITLEFSDYDGVAAPLEEDGTYQWFDSGVSITGPAGAAIGSEGVDVDNTRHHRARLKIEATADCNLEIMNGWEES
jgi:hypothetical protein